MLPSPLPPEAVFYSKAVNENSGLDSLLEHLCPEERGLISKWSSLSRQISFAAGRYCAHQALNKLAPTNSVAALLRGTAGEVVWPDGICGSIAHTNTKEDHVHQAAAAVGLQQDFQGMGIDIESLIRPVKLDIIRHICLPEEANWVNEYSSEAELRLKKIFSAKECVYKAVYHVNRAALGFKDAQLHWLEEKESFSVFVPASLKSRQKEFRFSVKVIAAGDYLLSGAVIKRFEA